MGRPAAKNGDKVTGVCSHTIQPPAPATPVLTPGLPFAGIISGGLSSDVRIQGQFAATKDSTADNTPPHVPSGGTFVNTPTNKATVKAGSGTVKINGKPAARTGDTAETCDEAHTPGTVAAVGTVSIGG